MDGRRGSGRRRRPRGQRRPRAADRVAARGALSRPRAARRAGRARRSSWQPHSQGEWNVETVIGHFVDAAWAYRFGPPAQDAIVVTLAQEDEEGARESEGANILSQAFRFPAGWPLERESPERLGLSAQAQQLPDGNTQLVISSQRLVYGVEIHAPGFLPSDDGFSIEPGGKRVVTLRPRDTDDTGATSYDGGILTAPNLAGRIPIESA